MKMNSTVAAIAAALLLASPLVASAKSASKSFPIAAQNGSGETGTVTLTPAGAKTTVVVALTGAPADAQPAHIHPGSCTNLTPAPKYPLTSLMAGKSTTVVDASMSSLIAGGFAVNVHKSANDLKDYVACGDLGSSMMKSDSMHAMPAASPSP